MAKLANTVLTDRATTPVAHTFIPRDTIPDNSGVNVGTLVETSGIPVGESRLTQSLRKTASGRYKARLTLVVPIVVTETVNGVSRPLVVREGIADVTFTFDSESSEAERNNLVGMFQSAFDVSKTFVNDTVVKLTGVY